VVDSAAGVHGPDAWRNEIHRQAPELGRKGAITSQLEQIACGLAHGALDEVYKIAVIVVLPSPFSVRSIIAGDLLLGRMNFHA